MKIKVTKEAVAITENSCINDGEVGINTCEFDLPECFEGLSVTAVFNKIPVPIYNNVCNIPSLKKGTATVGVYAYANDMHDVVLMYSPKPAVFYVNCGSYTEDTCDEERPFIGPYEEYCRLYANRLIESLSEYGAEKTLNKVTEIGSTATDEQYPSTKAVYDFVTSELGDLPTYGAEMSENKVTEIGSTATDEQYPSAKAVYDFVSQEYDTETDKPISGVAIGQGLSEAVANANRDFVAEALTAASNSVEGISNGCAVLLKDVSPIKHTVAVTVRNNKNLCSIGSAVFKQLTVLKNIVEIPAGDYVFSAVIESSDVDSNNCAVFFKNSKTGYQIGSVLPRSSGNSRVSCTFKTLQPIDEFAFYSSNTFNNGLNDTTSFTDIKVEKGSTATEYTPYIDLSTVSLKICGKNLFKDYIKSKTYDDGSAITVNDDGSVTCNMVEGTVVSFETWIRLPAGTYTISDGVDGDKTPYVVAVFYRDKNNTSSTYVGEIGTKSTLLKKITTDKTYDVKLLMYTSSSRKSKFTLYPQLEIGDTATEYEKYITESETPFSTDGCVYVPSISRNMSVVVSETDLDVEIKYKRDINKVLESFQTRYAEDITAIKNAIVSLGGNI